MARTKKNATTKKYHPAIGELGPDVDLGLAMLIAEDEEGHHEPVAVVATINEAKEIAESDLRSRMRCLERGDDPGICPYTYKVWARDYEGHYALAREMDAAGLKPIKPESRSYYSRSIGRRVTIPE